MANNHELEIVDIHASSDAFNARAMRDEIVHGLQGPKGEKTLPTMLLYDERGLQLYDDITTHAPEYYLFGAEEEILKSSAKDIVKAMTGNKDVVVAPDDEEDSVRNVEDTVVLELGAGALRKTSHVLRALADAATGPLSYLHNNSIPNHHQHNPPFTYYALDLEQRELQRTLSEIRNSDLGMELEGKVATKGLCGTYEDGMKFVKFGGLETSDGASRANVAVERARDAAKSLEKNDRDSSRSSNGSDGNHSNHFDNVEDASNQSSPPSTPEEHVPPLHLLFLGSSLGNFSRAEQVNFLKSLPLQPGSGDTLLLGLDHDNDKTQIEEAYNDKSGYTKAFIMNGLKGAGRVLGDEQLFDENNWEYVNNYDDKNRQHAAYYRCKTDHTISTPSGDKLNFLEGELVNVEKSLKFSDHDAFTLFIDTNFRPIQRWTDSKGQYSLWLLERPAFQFPLLRANSISTTPFGIPSTHEWTTLWQLWDNITLHMIPPSMLFTKPIDLRHICLFYLGHIPAFRDIHMSRLLDEPHTEPEHFKDIFERGIDPHVDDPTQCHAHSEVPTSDGDWPKFGEIVAYAKRTRQRVLNLYKDIEDGKKVLDRKMGRVLFMTYEHEALHAETLLYMLLQRSGEGLSGTQPPIGFAKPDWESLAQKWDVEVDARYSEESSSSVILGPETLSVGHDDDEDDDREPEANAGDAVRGHEFGWDNEHPRRQVELGRFRIEWRPITNGDFDIFYRSHSQDKGVSFPASWIRQPNSGETHVRTLYGSVPLKIAQHWPVMTTFDNLSRYATVKGGRLPTEPELRLFYDKFESGYEGGANVGFRNWHPVPATTGGAGVGASGGGGSGGGSEQAKESEIGIKGTNGGVWEWTSTLLETYDGFKTSKLYPGYSADFFDNAHQVVLGGSFATIPRIAQRRSVRNWYQRNYPYMWVGGRVAYDL